MSTHFVARLGQELYFFYPKGPSLCYRIWQKGRLLTEDVLHESIKLPFSVFFQSDLLHVFCQDTKGDILLFVYRNNSWNSRTALQGQGGDYALLTPITSEDNLCILYNGFADTDAPCLFKRAFAAGEWQQAEALDYFKPFSSHSPYAAQATGPGHLLLFYQTQAEECQVGYREVTPKRTGPFHRFLNVKGSLSDASFLTTRDEVHVLMIVRTAYSCQLIYRKKTEDAFTPEILLWEAPRITQCLLTIIGAELHATCMIGGKLHQAISPNNGDSFEPMTLYKRKFCAEPARADYISDEGHIKLRQVYVDQSAPWDVQMLPDLSPGFYPDGQEESAQVKELEDSLAMAKRSLEEKDRQIMELMLQSKVPIDSPSHSSIM